MNFDVFSLPFLAKQNKLVQLAVCCALAVGVFLLTSILGVRTLGLYEDLKSFQATEVKKLEELSNNQRVAASLKMYENAVKEAQDTLNEVKKRLPTLLDASSFVEQLNKNALQNGLEVKISTPLAEEKQDFYFRSPVRISGCATYHQLGSFVASLSQLERIITLDNFTMQNSWLDKAIIPPKALSISAADMPSANLYDCSGSRNVFNAVIATYRYAE